MNDFSPYLERQIPLECSITLQEWNTCEDKHIAALKKKYRHSWGCKLFHHCHHVPGVPHPWQITYQQPYSNIFQHNATSHASVSSWVAAVVGMEAVLSTQSHVTKQSSTFQSYQHPRIIDWAKGTMWTRNKEWDLAFKVEYPNRSAQTYQIIYWET